MTDAIQQTPNNEASIQPPAQVNQVQPQAIPNAQTLRTAAPTSPSRRQRDTSVTRQGKPGTRKHQRWLNKNFLLEQSRDMDLRDLDYSIYEPRHSIFSRMLESRANMEMLSQFVNITEERQRALLQKLQIRDQESQTGRRFTSSPVKAFQLLDKRLKKLVLDYHGLEYFQKLDQEIYRFINSEEKCRMYIFDDGFHRLTCHAMCKYYQLKSASQDFGNDRRLFIYKFDHGLRMPLALCQFLSTYQPEQEIDIPMSAGNQRM